MTLALALLGPMHVTLDGQSVTGFKYDKVRALLAYLAVEADRPHERQALLGMLWPDLPEDAARNNLRQTLLTLREAIGDRAAQPPFLLTSRATIQFNRASDHWLDVSAFTALLAACERHAHANAASCKACAQRLQQTVDLYRGPFLAEFFLPDSEAFEEWAVLKREGLHRLLLTALERLVAYHERRGQYERALGCAQRLLALDPWREEIHRDAIRLHLLNGERSAALEQFAQCRRVLADELGLEPEPETQALYEHIRDGHAHRAGALSLPSARRHTLPSQPTPFVGREAELAEIGRMLDSGECRLLTLIGPGGIGKTRLALQAATERVDTFVDGVFFVPLAGLPTADMLGGTLATALELESGAAADLRAQLLHYLRDKELLLVLDNFEHLLDGTELLTDILHHAPEVTLLVTSRARLNLRAEWLFDVPGLPLPYVPSRDEPVHEATATNDAVQLFVQSARRVCTGFTLTIHNQASVVQICRLVAGMPLAIELAAALVRALSCMEIAQELERGSAFLTTTARDTPARHRSLRAVFEHSWQLLPGEEQRTLRRLAVFRGGFRREAAEELGGATLTELTSLIDTSLIRYNRVGRYDLHELVRQYAEAKLVSADEDQPIRRRYADYYLKLAETAETHFFDAEQQTWLTRLEEEHDNLRTVLQWALGAGALETALRLAGALTRFWAIRGHLGEGRNWLEQALKQPGRDDISTHVRLKALNGAGTLARLQGDLVGASQWLNACLALSRIANETRWSAIALNALGLVARFQGDLTRATALYEESLALSRAVGDQRSIVNALANLASVVNIQGNHERAAMLYEESLAFSRAAGDKLGIAADLNNLGNAVFELGEYDRAWALYEESRALYAASGDQYGVSLALCNLGDLAHHRGHTEHAQAYLAESLALAHTLSNNLGCIEALEKLAWLAVTWGVPERAAQLWGAAEQQRATLGAARSPQEAAEHATRMQSARALLDEAAFAAAWAKGQSMSLEAAVAFAQGGDV